MKTPPTAPVPKAGEKEEQSAAIDKIEVPIKGIDYAECTQHAQHSIAGLKGAESVEVSLSAEKAKVKFDPELAGLPPS